MKSERLTASLSDIAARSPRERLEAESRYLVVADFRMGDGGKKDELAGSRKALFAILGKWYLPRGYTLVLNGDIEDLRSYWIKDILAAWPEMYALFDAFAEAGRLRKILGERDLTLLRLSSYPYELHHGLVLERGGIPILLSHGHQASPPYLGRDYLSDYIQHWIGSSKRPPVGGNPEGRERYKTERRLYRASNRLGMALIEGHTKRPLFQSFANRDFLVAELERLFQDAETRRDRPGIERSAVDELIKRCRKEAKARTSGSRRAVSGPGYGGGEEISPGLFCPGRIIGARGLRMLEIEGDELRLAYWTKSKRKGNIRASAEGSGESDAERQILEGTPYARATARRASVGATLGRVAALARKESGQVERLLSPPG
jgi:hypothetical protein